MAERVAVVVPNLVLGGVQRSGITIAEMLAVDHPVTLLSLGPAPMAEGYDGPVEVRVGPPSRARDVRARLGRQTWLRRQLDEVDPAVVISLTPGPTTMAVAGLLGRRRRTKLVFAERNDYRVKVERPGVRLARAAAYRLSDAVVVQTESLAAAVAERRSPPPTTVIPNALDRAFGEAAAAATERAASPAPERAPVVLWVGRLVPQKRTDHAIRAFATVAPAHPAWRLEIVGDGPERAALEALVASKGLGDRASFHGAVAAPGPHYADASVLLLTSAHEGFPNVLVEAMAFGVPVISYDCPSGPSEIVRDGKGGVLVANGDVAAVGRELDALLAAPERRERLATEAVEAVAGFTYDGVGLRWRELVAGLVAGAR